MPWVRGHPKAILAKLLLLQATVLLSAEEAARYLLKSLDSFPTSPPFLSTELL